MAQLAILVLLDHLVDQDLKVLLVLQVLWVNLALRALQAYQVTVETLADQDLLVL